MEAYLRCPSSSGLRSSECSTRGTAARATCRPVAREVRCRSAVLDSPRVTQPPATRPSGAEMSGAPAQPVASTLAGGLGDVGEVHPTHWPWLLRLGHVRARTSGQDSSRAMQVMASMARPLGQHGQISQTSVTSSMAHLQSPSDPRSPRAASPHGELLWTRAWFQTTKSSSRSVCCRGVLFLKQRSPPLKAGAKRQHSRQARGLQAKELLLLPADGRCRHPFDGRSSSQQPCCTCISAQAGAC